MVCGNRLAFYAGNPVFGQSMFLAKNRFFGQKQVFRPKIDFLVKSKFLGQKSIFWSKASFLAKNTL